MAVQLARDECATIASGTILKQVVSLRGLMNSPHPRLTATSGAANSHIPDTAAVAQYQIDAVGRICSRIEDQSRDARLASESIGACLTQRRS
jgi:hypothetical protein